MKNGCVFSICLNRIDKKNALTLAMYESMSAGLSRAAADEDVRVVLIQAKGDAFCSGDDLHDFSKANQGKLRLEELPTVRFMQDLLSFEKPVVAAVNGLAVGIGVTMLMHCDVVVAGRTAVLSLPFTKLGLVPEFGSTYVLCQVAGRVPASETLLLGEPFGVARAEQLGLVSTICDDAEVEAVAIQKCESLAALPAGTLRQTKSLLNTTNRAAIEDAIRRELKLFGQALTSEDHRKALAAFFGKAGKGGV